MEKKMATTVIMGIIQGLAFRIQGIRLNVQGSRLGR